MLEAKRAGEVRQAKSLERKARLLSEAVIRELHVRNGRYNVQEWYKSHAARKSSLQSTKDVDLARKQWELARQVCFRCVCCDFVRVWVCGVVWVWVCGCVGVWVCGSVFC
jgi:hypothetical protein